MAITRLGGANAISGTLPAANINATSLGNVDVGKVLQVVYAEDTGLVSSTSTTYADTGLSGTITPSSTSSKILIHVTLADLQKVVADTYLRCRTLRDGSSIFTFVGQAGYTGSTASNNAGSVTAHYLDSPASTSALIYKTQFHNASGGGTVYITPDGNSRSTMILMEIAG